jgi:8-oxo-dGTP diphosphatase
MTKFYVALKAIVVKNNELLAIKRSDAEEVYTNLWDIPGGRMNFGEDPQYCLKREVKEETGIDIDIVRPYNVWSFKPDERSQVVGITFECIYRRGDVTLSHEHSEYKWIDPDEFQHLDADDNLKKEIAKYSEERKSR